MSATAIFYACQKDSLMDGGGLKSHKSSGFYDQELLNKFMNERLVQELKEYVNSLEIKKSNGILNFGAPCCVEELYDKLIEYSQRWDALIDENPIAYQQYVESERFPDDPMLFAFEVITDFYSLRAHIENQLLELEAGDGIPDEGSPDDHFIISEYMRTLLTPDCEIIAGNTISITGRYQDLIILDLDFKKLEEAKSLWRQYGEIEGTVEAVQRGLAEPIYNPELKSGNDPCTDLCNALHLKHQLLSPSNACPYKYQFSVYNNFIGTCNCIINGTGNIKWNFGDGTSGTGSAVTHEYKKGGTYNVTVQIRLHDGVSEKVCTKTLKLDIEDCNVTINTPVRDYSYTGTGAKYTFTANASHCDGAKPKEYIWNFGDGTTERTTTDRVEHIYKLNGTKTTTVKVDFGGCTADNTFDINVSGTGNCCREYTGDMINVTLCYDANGNPIHHDKSIYKFSHSFTTRQWHLWHRIVVKNTLYKRKNGKIGGKWKEEKAYKMFANFSGEIADGRESSCRVLYPITPSGETKNDKKSHTYDYGVRDFISWLEWFSVAKESIGSEFKLYINSTQTDHKKDALKLHQKNCP